MSAVNNLVPAMFYGRVSSTQNESDLDNQYLTCQESARLNGIEIIHCFKDKVSGYREIFGRKELVHMLNRCHTEGIKHIVVSNLSRLTRSMRDGILLLDWFHRHGIELHICEHSYLKKAGYLDIIRELWEAEKVHDKYATAEASTSGQGLHIMGRPLLGYRKERNKRKWVKDGNCPFNIADIFGKALEFRENCPKLSIAEIAKHIALEFIKNGESKPSASTIKNILANPLYTGRQSPKGTFDLEILRQYPLVHDAYISDEAFVILNRGKIRRKLRLLELTICNTCKVNLNLNGELARCPKCNKSISINQLHEDILQHCRKYIYDPDETLECRLNDKDHCINIRYLY